MSDFSLRMQDMMRQMHMRGSIVYADGTSCAIDGGHILSASIDEGADGALTPGCVLSAGCTLELANDAGQWLPGGDMLHYQTLTGAGLKLELGVGAQDDVLWQDMGTFTIVRALYLEQEARLRIEAVDGISAGMAAAFQDGLAYPATLEALWRQAALQMGLVFSGDVPNGGAVISAAPEWNGASLRAALGYIAAAAGCFVRIGRGGALELCRAWDDAQPYAIDAGGYMRLECSSAKFGPVDMLRVTPVGGDVRSYTSDGTGVGLYSFAVSENPLFCEGDGLDALSIGLLAQVAGYESVQADFDWRGDPELCIGRRVLITDVAGRQVQGVLSRQTLRFDGGFSASCSCAVPDESSAGIRRILTADGSLNAGTLVGSVDGGLLKAGSVTAEKIAAGVISAQALQAVSAYIGELAAGNITTDQLYADLATIAAAQITAANIEKANIDWASIDTLNASIADISLANIQTADIDYAKIKDLVTGTAIITEGVGGQLYIARLAVTEANMVQLTVGSLMLKAEDGSFVRLIADGSGGVTTETVAVEGENIADATISGTNLIENTITARELNVEKIFADTALIRAIKAANIDVSDLFAASATIEQLDSWVISASTIQALEGALDLWASEKINIAVGEIDTSTAENVRNSSVTITPDMVRILTSLFSVQNEETGMTLDEEGLSAEHVSAPNLQERYTGATAVTVGTGGDYGSLAAFASEVSGKYVPETVTVTLLSDMAGEATLKHVSGADIIIEGGGYSMYAPLNVENCGSYVQIKNLTLSYSGSLASVYNGSRVYLSSCIFNTSSTARSGASVRLDRGALLFASNCQFYNTLGRLINVWGLSRCVLGWCAGAITTGPYAFAVLEGADLRSYGSYPAGAITTDASATYTLNGTEDSGTAQGTASALTTQEFTCTLSDTCRGSSNWDGSGYVWQGYTSSVHRGYMWFDGLADAISGKTVKSATLKLKRVKGIGRSGSTVLNAYYSLKTGNSGSYSIQTGYGGELGGIGNDEEKVFDLPLAILTRMQAYGYGGICLYSAETSAMEGKNYSKNYCKIYGADSEYAPVLTVTYQ